ncbi:LamG domain-containing protein [Streptomyces sp. NPDC002328]|uniref:LamG domain-containing protein n=1 Tax=Streptomyces sp. NPDC002328 TaxID=3364642 RepID=UPI00367D6392
MRGRNVAGAVRARATAALGRGPARSGGSPRRRRVVAGVVAALSVVAAAVGLTLSATAPAQAGVTDGLLLWYKLNATTAANAADSSGHNNNGWIYGSVDWRGDEGLAFDGSSTYIKMPDNLMAGLSSITVAFDVWIDPAMGSPYFLYGLGSSSGTSGNGYLFSTGNQFHTAVTLSDWHAEQNTKPNHSYQLDRGMWKHVAYTQTGTTGILYENGAEMARNTGVTITPGAIGNGTTTADYIGRSLYSSDKYFKGRMRDFRIYNRALAQNEVAELANYREVQWEQLQALADNNGALSLFRADVSSPGQSGAQMVFPADVPSAKFCPSCLAPPTGWKSDYGITPTTWPQPEIMQRSQFTQQQINDIEDAIVAQVQPSSDTLVRDTTYQLTYFYDGKSDRIVAQTDAPASVTDSLKTAYPGKVTIQALPSTAPVDKCTDQTRTAGQASELTPVPAAGLTDDRTDQQWQQVEALRDYNCALAAYDDPTTGPVLVFPSDRTNLTVANPSDWTSPFGQKPTGWPVPTARKSARFTLAQIKDIQAAAVRRLSRDGVPDGAASYSLSVYYDGQSDRVVVETDAPSSATDPLVTAYPNQITITPYTPPTPAPAAAEQTVN